jgi:hypothetical protein
VRSSWLHALFPASPAMELQDSDIIAPQGNDLLRSLLSFAPADLQRGYSMQEVESAGEIQVAKQMLAAPGMLAFELLFVDGTPIQLEIAAGHELGEEVEQEQQAQGEAVAGEIPPSGGEAAMLTDETTDPPSAPATDSAAEKAMPSAEQTVAQPAATAATAAAKFDGRDAAEQAAGQSAEIARLRRLLQERDAAFEALRKRATADNGAADATVGGSQDQTVNSGGNAMEIEPSVSVLEALQAVKSEVAAVRQRQDSNQKAIKELRQLHAAQKCASATTPGSEPASGPAFQRGRIEISAAEEAAAELQRRHRALHPSELWLDSIPDDVHAAAKALPVLQEAVRKQTEHVAAAKGSIESRKESMTSLMSDCQAELDKGLERLGAQHAAAVNRLHLMTPKLTTCTERAKPRHTKILDVVRTLLDDSKSEYDGIVDGDEEATEHCTDCCDYEPEDHYGYHRHRRHYYDEYDRGGECPHEDCAGTECDCYSRIRFLKGETFDETIVAAMDSVLEQADEDQESCEFEDAAARLMALDTVTMDWKFTVDSDDWCVAMERVGAAWLNLVIHLQPRAPSLVTEIEAHFDTMLQSSEANSTSELDHGDALVALQRPWDNPLLTDILANGTGSKVEIEAEPERVVSARLEFLLSEKRESDALNLAQYSKQRYYECIALAKLGQLQDCVELAGQNCTEICEREKYENMLNISRTVTENATPGQTHLLFQVWGHTLCGGLEFRSKLPAAKQAAVTLQVNAVCHSLFQALKLRPPATTDSAKLFFSLQDSRGCVLPSCTPSTAASSLLATSLRLAGENGAQPPADEHDGDDEATQSLLHMDDEPATADKTQPFPHMLFAAGLMCLSADAATLKKLANELHAMSYGLEGFLLAQKVCSLLKPATSYGYNAVATQENSLHLTRLLDLARKTGDVAAMETAVSIAEAACKRIASGHAYGGGAKVTMLTLAKHCRESGHLAGAVALAQKSRRVSGAEAEAAMDLLIELAADDAVGIVPDLIREAETGALKGNGFDKLVAFLYTRDEYAKDTAKFALISLKQVSNPVQKGQMDIIKKALTLAIKGGDEGILRQMIAVLKLTTPKLVLNMNLLGPATDASASRGRYSGYSHHSNNAKQIPPFDYQKCRQHVEKTLTQWRQTQSELHGIVADMVDYKPLAQQLLIWLESWEDPVKKAMDVAFRTMIAPCTSGFCRSNHGYWRTQCYTCNQKCVKFVGGAAEYLHYVHCLSGANAANAAGKIVIALAKTIKFKFVQQEVASLVNNSLQNKPQLQPTPQFPGFTQPVLTVARFEELPRARICSKRDDLPLGSAFSDYQTCSEDDGFSAAAKHLSEQIRSAVTAAGVGNVLAGALPKKDSIAKRCEEDMLDTSVLFTMSESEFQAVLGLGGDIDAINLTSDFSDGRLKLLEWVDARSCWLEVIHANTDELTMHEKLAYAELQAVQASFGGRFTAAKALWHTLHERSFDLSIPSRDNFSGAGIDARVFRSLSDEELEAIVAPAQENIQSVLALRNVFRQSPAGMPQFAPPSGQPVDDADLFTVVIIGGTGAGKSTCMNALLGEAQLLPTNCMRACTATIIEMQYNALAEPGGVYRCTIEFLGQDEWRAELELLCSVIQDAKAAAAAKNSSSAAAAAAGGGGKEDAAAWLVPGTPAADAVTKLRSIYGNGEGDKILTGCADTMQALPLELLGQYIKLKAASSAELQDAVAPYTDSSNDTASGAAWPLVKRVVLYGPWDVLMPGVRLVDAPGLHDDNSCRANMVKKQLHEADAVWLCSNIRRAVNDKTTKVRPDGAFSTPWKSAAVPKA